jgi:hypothetical protein
MCCQTSGNLCTAEYILTIKLKFLIIDVKFESVISTQHLKETILTLNSDLIMEQLMQIWKITLILSQGNGKIYLAEQRTV